MSTIDLDTISPPNEALLQFADDVVLLADAGMLGQTIADVRAPRAAELLVATAAPAVEAIKCCKQVCDLDATVQDNGAWFCGACHAAMLERRAAKKRTKSKPSTCARAGCRGKGAITRNGASLCVVHHERLYGKPSAPASAPRSRGRISAIFNRYPTLDDGNSQSVRIWATMGGPGTGKRR